eukprot:437490_1
MSSLSWFWDLLLVVIRSLKVIVRWMLGTHELERLLGGNFTNDMAFLLEKYINKSKQLKSIQAAMRSPSLDVNIMYQKIISMKQLDTNTSIHKTFIAPNLKKSLKMIQCYNLILRNMEESIIKFDTKNKDHQSILFQFWSKMDPLTLHSNLNNPTQEIEFKYDNNNFVPLLTDKAWEFIGFQAEKPWTDFRGVGIFGLKQLSYFANNYCEQSQNILSYCIQYGQLECFSYAITGINISYDVMQWFRLRKVNLFYYKYIYDEQNEINNGLNAIHLLYCKAYTQFYNIWKANPPKTVMGYSDIHKKFIKKTELDLENDELRLL